MWDFPSNPDVHRIIREIYENNGPVGAVCHGPSALVNVTLSDGSYLVDGKQISSFTDSEERAVQLDGVVPFFAGQRTHGPWRETSAGTGLEQPSDCGR